MRVPSYSKYHPTPSSRIFQLSNATACQVSFRLLLTVASSYPVRFPATEYDTAESERLMTTSSGKRSAAGKLDDDCAVAGGCASADGGGATAADNCRAVPFLGGIVSVER